MNKQESTKKVLREEDRYDDKVGKTFWFEYHCYESPESCDAEIWYRSHQKVKVIGVSEWSYDDKEWRQEDGNSRVYLVEWIDGYQYDVFEDELFESPNEFYRPFPPKRKIQESIRRILREELETTPTKEKGEKMGTGDWALPYKNPMALIQKSPDDWDGLEGDDNGRLKFKEMKYGVRAGVKNLKNTYFLKGIRDTTLIDLFKKYAPSGHGANNPSNYADFVANKIGVKVTDKLSWDKYGKKISRSIINFETGIPIGGSKNKVNGVTEDEFETGYTLVNS